MAKLPTVEIRYPQNKRTERAIINEADYDPDKHTLYHDDWDDVGDTDASTDADTASTEPDTGSGALEDREELLAYCQAQGIRVAANIGTEKLAERVREHRAEQAGADRDNAPGDEVS